MKLIKIDGLDRDYIPDVLIKDNLTQEEGIKLLQEVIANYGSDLVWFELVEDDYRLSKGIEDCIIINPDDFNVYS
jgi:hypothetical protein